jgi:hypothetical protein
MKFASVGIAASPFLKSFNSLFCPSNIIDFVAFRLCVIRNFWDQIFVCVLHHSQRSDTASVWQKSIQSTCQSFLLYLWLLLSDVMRLR